MTTAIAAATLLDRAWSCLNEGDHRFARTLATDALASSALDEHLSGEAHLIRGQSFFMDGENDGEDDDIQSAKTSLTTAIGLLDREDAEILTDAANLAIALGKLDVAAELADTALAATDDSADAFYVRGLIANAAGDGVTQVRCFQRTAEIDLKEPVPPWSMTTDDFTAVVEESFAPLPEAIKVRLEEIPIIVEPAPSAELIADGIDPRLFVLFSKVFAEESANQQPTLNAIHIYQRNLEAECSEGTALAEEIRDSVEQEAIRFFDL